MPRTPSATDHRPRLTPPAHLSVAESKAFRLIVATLASDHFAKSDVPLLVEYCRAVALADQAAAAMAAEGVVVDGKGSPWLVVQEKAQRGLVALSARLRVCPQSRFDRTTAGTKSRGGLPLYESVDSRRPKTGLASFR